MKITSCMVAITAAAMTLISPNLFAKEDAYKYQVDSKNDISIRCTSTCDIEKEMLEFLSYKNNLPRSETRFSFYSYGEKVESLTMKEFLEQYSPKKKPFNSDGSFNPNPIGTKLNKSKTSENKGATKADDLGAFFFDHPLECEHDRQYSCQDWLDNDLIVYINNTELSFKVTQEFIDANNNARSIAITAATTLYVGRMVQKAAQAVSATIAPGLTETILATFSSHVLTGTDWYKSDLNVGDTITFKNGRSTVIRAADGASNTNRDNVQTFEYGDRNYGNSNWDIGRFGCRIVYTNSGAGFVAQIVCY